MTPEEITLAQNTEKTRKLVDRQIVTFKMGLDPNPKPSSWLTIRSVKTSPENNAEYEKALETLKPVLAESAKGGHLTGWSFWAHTFFNAASPWDYSSVSEYATLDDALKFTKTGLNTASEFKKVYPTQDYKAYSKRLLELRHLVSLELWQRVIGTEAAPK